MDLALNGGVNKRGMTRHNIERVHHNVERVHPLFVLKKKHSMGNAGIINTAAAHMTWLLLPSLQAD